MTRRGANLVAAILLMCAVAAGQNGGTGVKAEKPQGGPIVGAIRWDAWHGNKGGPGLAVERSLGPKQWQWRLPFFAKVVSDNEVKIPGYTPEIIEQEIAYARQAGLDYWAFVLYEPESSMSEALNLYLASPRKKDIAFCVLMGPSGLGGEKDRKERIERLVKLMTEASYQKVMAGRPILYLGFITDAWIKAWGGESRARQIVDGLRSAVKKAGMANPYIVILDFKAEQGKRFADILGANAISAYAIGGNEKGAPYAALTTKAEEFWEKCKTAGAKVVPIATAGWDRRPRIEHPVPWEKYQKPGVGIECYFQTPTPAELAAHVERAVRWVQKNPDVAESRAILIYAWNENDEGGWLVPTLSEGTARVEALSRVLRKGVAGETER